MPSPGSSRAPDMSDDSVNRWGRYAEVIVRVGLNLQPGQPLLITDPYEQHGVAPEAEELVGALRLAAERVGAGAVDPIWSEPQRLRQLVEQDDREAFRDLVRRNYRRMDRHVAAGGALLFLTGSAPRLFHGLPEARLAAFSALNWGILGFLVQRLVRGATQWTLAPAPSRDWAALAFADLPADRQLQALWDAVLAAVRLNSAEASGRDAVASWQTHLASLQTHADTLNTRRVRTVRYEADGTDLTVELPRAHHWCTAQLRTPRGVPFVVNLPTEELYTAPHRGSARGTVRVARPVVHAGTVIDGIELTFERGRVVRSSARSGADLLQRLLAEDPGACRLGEVALLATDLGTPARPWQAARALFHHPLLDENAANHIALGEAYPACHRGWWKAAVNRSLIHVDLPLAARVTLG